MWLLRRLLLSMLRSAHHTTRECRRGLFAVSLCTGRLHDDKVWWAQQQTINYSHNTDSGTELVQGSGAAAACHT